MKQKIVEMAENKASRLFKLLQDIVDKINVINDNMMTLNDNMREIDEKLERILKR